jgi:hypothetical protein
LLERIGAQYQNGKKQATDERGPIGREIFFVSRGVSSRRGDVMTWI